ncbi:MAG: enoyl-CoA hydratase/isomerase family protein [Actinobacteria bacterium]|nr:enoyl-CoA hydratase/isomerase family protein [Actinomycetota bacterium]
MDAVSYEVVDRVAVITIERPERRNAMDVDVFGQLRERALQAAGDRDVGAVLVGGRDGVFSSGIDTSVFGGQAEGGITLDFIDRLQSAFTAYEDLDKPTVALVEGHCYGAGFQLAIACHVRLAAPTARMSLMEASWGLVPDLGGTYRLPRLVGLGRATELALTARVVEIDEIVAIGLAERRLGSDDPRAEALELARRLANGPHALREIPRLMRENAGRDRPAGLQAEALAQVRCIQHPDFAEAVTARFEGRDPRFSGA